MDNKKAITCRECVYHYTNDFENPIGTEWCLMDKCVKAEKVDYRQRTREENVKYINYERED